CARDYSDTYYYALTVEYFDFW
nr:immunoglobulin heavy chain junction region [Macaca mulatta]MOV51862.1 immunoglobulin heavy chain junction region [Macaca mulatta]MOV52415.1 immunoglobulin heavy chain junction region [Macaca mulatta]